MSNSINNKRLTTRLVNGIFNYGLGKILPKIVGFLLIPLYTIYLSPEDYGIIELSASLSAFIVPLMRVGLPGSVSRFYYDFKEDKEALSEYISTVHKLLILLSIVIGLLSSVVLMIWGEVLVPGLLFSPFIVLVVLTATMSSNSDLQNRLIQSREQSRYSAKLNLIFALIGILLALFFVVILKMGALGLIISQLINAGIFFIQAQYYLMPDLKNVFNRSHMMSSIKYGSGILPHNLLAVSSPLISKAILSGTHSMEELGVFGLALRFIQPMTLVAGSFQTAFSPIYFSIRKKIDDELDSIQTITNLLVVIFYFSTAFFLLSITFIPPVIPIVTPEVFHASAILVPIVAISFIGQMFYQLVFIEIFYLKKTWLAPIVTGFGSLVNIGLSLILIEKYGTMGIAWAFGMTPISWMMAAILIRVFFKENKLPMVHLFISLMACALGFWIVSVSWISLIVKMGLNTTIAMMLIITNLKRIKFLRRHT